MNRIAVRYKGLPLMPMTCARARILCKEGKAKIKFDRKLNLHYVQLLVEPSGYDTQEISLGIDPGSTFDGVTILSKKCHHLNVELIHRPKKGKNSIKSFKARQAMNRRVRRSRLRHRPIRFDNRTSSKLVPTVQADIDFRKWLVIKLSAYYPINKVVIEDVRFNHYRDLIGKNRLSGHARGKSFSHVEVGKLTFYNWLADTGYYVDFVEGFDTKELRLKYLFGVDTKAQDKAEKSFEAHCLDSFVIAGKDYNLQDVTINKRVIFLEKTVKQRRSLTRTRAKYKDASRYFRYAKGGVKVYFEAKSNKLNKCRVKPESEHSNHPKRWEYIDNGYATKFKSNTAQYGGTVINGKRKFYDKEYKNRTIHLTT